MSIHIVSNVVVHIMLHSCVAANQLAQAPAGDLADALHLLTHGVSSAFAYANAIPYLFVSCLRLQVCTAHVARSLLPGEILCMMCLLLTCIHGTLCRYAPACVFGNAQYVCLLDLLAFTCCSSASTGARGFTLYSSGAIARRGQLLMITSWCTTIKSCC